jgi:hypothetical protein
MEWLSVIWVVCLVMEWLIIVPFLVGVLAGAFFKYMIDKE